MNILRIAEKLAFKIMNTKNTKTKVNRIVNAMKESKGKFFSLTTNTSSGPISAQFLMQTPCYVWVRDRNAGENRKFAKRTLQSLKMGSVEI